jgi:SAM-dependent methyltransferase
MAVNILTVAWLSRLAQKGALRGGGSVLDLGPQDLVLCDRSLVDLYARRHNSPEIAAELVGRMFDGQNYRTDCAAPLYALFGYERYRSVDLMDPRADWKLDLNYPMRLPERFDLVTNFGTAEHVFNIAAVFRSMHDALKPGGVGLHILPTFGEVDHGFFNIHPTLYFDIARANNYVVEDVCYLDSIDVRCYQLLSDPTASFDFDKLPIQELDLRQTATIWSKILEHYRETVRQYEAGQIDRGRHHVVPTLPKDYVYVALRKQTDAPFRIPFQGAFGLPDSIPRNRLRMGFANWSRVRMQSAKKLILRIERLPVFGPILTFLLLRLKGVAYRARRFLHRVKRLPGAIRRVPRRISRAIMQASSRTLRRIIPACPRSLLRLLALPLLLVSRILLRAHRMRFAGRGYFLVASMRHGAVDAKTQEWMFARCALPLRVGFDREVGLEVSGAAKQLFELATAIIACGEAERAIASLEKLQRAGRPDPRQLALLVELYLRRDDLLVASDLLSSIHSNQAFSGTSPPTAGQPALDRAVTFWLSYRLFALAHQEGNLDLASATHAKFLKTAAQDDREVAIAHLAAAEVAIARGNYAAMADSLSNIIAAARRAGSRTPYGAALLKRGFFGQIHLAIVEDRVDEAAQLAEHVLSFENADGEIACRNILFFLLRHRRIRQIELIRRMYLHAEADRPAATAEYFARLARQMDEDDQKTSTSTAAPSAAPERRRFILALPVWGPRYIKDLLTVAIPSLLGAGNVSDFVSEIDLEVVFYIDRDSQETLETSPVLAALRACATCSIVLLPDFLFDPRYAFIWGQKNSVLAYAHRLALLTAKQKNAGIIFWAPDVLCSENYLRAVKMPILDNKEVIFCFHPILDREQILRRLRPEHRSAYGTLSVSPDELKALLRPELMPLLRVIMFNGGVHTSWPWMIMRAASNGGFELRAFYHHPLVLSAAIVERYQGQVFFSNDSDLLPLLAGNAPDFSNWHLMAGHEPAAVCQLTTAAEVSWAAIGDRRADLLSDREISHWGYRQSAIARWLFAQPVVAGPANGNAGEIAWSDAERIVDRMNEMENTLGPHAYIAGYCLPTYPRAMP